MKEYIERELLLIGVDGCISVLYAEANGDPILEAAIKLVEATRDYIASLSAADVVEVVRCRDCKHITVGNIIRGQIYPACRKYKIMVGEDFFCADGERRETTHD